MSSRIQGLQGGAVLSVWQDGFPGKTPRMDSLLRRFKTYDSFTLVEYWWNRDFTVFTVSHMTAIVFLLFLYCATSSCQTSHSKKENDFIYLKHRLLMAVSVLQHPIHVSWTASQEVRTSSTDTNLQWWMAHHVMLAALTSVWTAPAGWEQNLDCTI